LENDKLQIIRKCEWVIHRNPEKKQGFGLEIMYHTRNPTQTQRPVLKMRINDNKDEKRAIKDEKSSF
jgi:hypothetical protein